MKWFKHDSNASVDAKIERLMMKYGLEGYGLYFYCLEMIARTVEPHNLTFELEHDAEIIGHRVGIHQDRVLEMMSYMVDLQLFEMNDRRIVTCLKLATRTDEYTQKIIKQKGVIGQTPDTLPTKSALSDKINKINKIKKKDTVAKRFAPPSLDELNTYITEKKLVTVDAESFLNFYESKGWMVGRNKMKSWKATASGWNARNLKEKGQNNGKNKQETYHDVFERGTSEQPVGRTAKVVNP